MNVHDLLQRDHVRLRRLVTRLHRTSERAVATRRRLWDELSTLLLDHAAFEETHLFPELASHPQTAEVVRSVREENHFARIVMEGVEALSVDDPRWVTRLAVLRDTIDHHVREEEKSMFPRSRKLIAKMSADRLAGLMRSARGAASGRGPVAPIATAAT